MLQLAVYNITRGLGEVWVCVELAWAVGNTGQNNWNAEAASIYSICTCFYLFIIVFFHRYLVPCCAPLQFVTGPCSSTSDQNQITDNRRWRLALKHGFAGAWQVWKLGSGQEMKNVFPFCKSALHRTRWVNWWKVFTVKQTQAVMLSQFLRAKFLHISIMEVKHNFTI